MSRVNVAMQISSFSSVSQFSGSGVSSTLWPHKLQHTGLPCSSPTPGDCSNSCQKCQWFYPAFSSSIARFSSCLQTFPTSGSFPMSQFFASRGQGIGASASASVLPVNIQDWFPSGWKWLDLLAVLLSSLFQHHSLKASILRCSAFFAVQLSHLYMTAGKTIALMDFYWQSNVSAF